MINNTPPETPVIVSDEAEEHARDLVDRGYVDPSVDVEALAMRIQVAWNNAAEEKRLQGE
jgi:hypothetical protein